MASTDVESSSKATQRISQDRDASIQAARPILHRLKEWRITNPATVTTSEGLNDEDSPSASVNFAHHVLSIYVYQALLRPVLHSDSSPSTLSFAEFTIDADFTLSGSDQDAHDLEMSTEVSSSSPGITKSTLLEDIIKPAFECALGTLNFTRDLTTRDLSYFWYSWSGVGFAVASNLIVHLVVQSPSETHATQAKQVMDAWDYLLTQQSRVCPMMQGGLGQLNAFRRAGLGHPFVLLKHPEPSYPTPREALSLPRDSHRCR